MEMTDREQQAFDWAIKQEYQSVAADYARTLAQYIKRQQASQDDQSLKDQIQRYADRLDEAQHTIARLQEHEQPNRIAIVAGLSDPFITEVHATRPGEIVIMVYSIETGVSKVYKEHDISPLMTLDGVICPDCEALIPPDGACWYCENKPIEEAQP